jgi:Putative zinc-finger
MSGRVLRFSGSRHQQAERLLPWLLNGTLEGEEYQAVAQHAESCEQCQLALVDLRAMQQACLTSTSAASFDPDLSFARLNRRLPQARKARIVSRWTSAMAAWTSTPAWFRTAAAVQCALVLAFGGFWLVREPTGDYRTLSDHATAAVPSSGDARLMVVFEPDISQARTQQLLRASGARIVNGPSDVGAYVLAVPVARAAAVRDGLRAAPGVSLVEDIGGAAAQ